MKRIHFISLMLGFLGITYLNAADDTAEKVVIGDKAPDFSLKSEKNETISLSDYKGKDVVLMFSRAHW